MNDPNTQISLLSFFTDILEWRQDKVQELINFTQGNATKVEEILDLYSADEFGKRQHEFVLDPTEEWCLICSEPANQHNQYKVCSVCTFPNKTEDMIGTDKCIHKYCRDCTRENMMVLMSKG